MGKVKYELSFEKLTFKFEGDRYTGQAVNRSMNRTFGSLLEAQNRVIDITPEEPINQPALPSAPVAVPLRRRRHRARPKPAANGESPSHIAVDANGATDAKSAKPRRYRSEGFRTVAYRAIADGYFASHRTAAEIHDELAKRGFTFDPKNVASELTTLTKKGFLAREKNGDGIYAYVKGSNDDYPRS